MKDRLGFRDGGSYIGGRCGQVIRNGIGPGLPSRMAARRDARIDYRVHRRMDRRWDRWGAD